MNGYKTLFFNALLAAWGVVEVFDWASVFPTEKAGFVLIIVGAIGSALRMYTSGPVGGEAK